MLFENHIHCFLKQTQVKKYSKLFLLILSKHNINIYHKFYLEIQGSPKKTHRCSFAKNGKVDIFIITTLAVFPSSSFF